jgi:ABC-type microcin C transport system permease subunit YejB
LIFFSRGGWFDWMGLRGIVLMLDWEQDLSHGFENFDSY